MELDLLRKRVPYENKCVAAPIYCFINLSTNGDKKNKTSFIHSDAKCISTGHGKTHKDAASVRATHAIPAACGLYYFEVKIVSKGRDGYV